MLCLGFDLFINMDVVEEVKFDLVLVLLSVFGMEWNIEELKKWKFFYIVYNFNLLKDIC